MPGEAILGDLYKAHSDLVNLGFDLSDLDEIEFTNQEQVRDALWATRFVPRVIAAIEEYGPKSLLGNPAQLMFGRGQFAAIDARIVTVNIPDNHPKRHLDINGYKYGAPVGYEYTIRAGLTDLNDIDPTRPLQFRYSTGYGDIIDCSVDQRADEAFSLSDIAAGELADATDEIAKQHYNQELLSRWRDLGRTSLSTE